MQTKINKVGFEIEGEFSEDFISHLNNNRKTLGLLGGDSTIRACSPLCTILKNEPVELIEFKSTPYKPTGIQKKSIDTIFKVFHEYANKNKFHWNKSCGFHIHISFKPVLPVEIWSLQFVKFFHQNLRKTFPDVWKLRSKNRFCTPNFKEQDIAYTPNHYDSINYLDALANHSTVEFRIFPVNEPKKMQEYMLFVIQQVEQFLAESEKRLHQKFKIYLTENRQQKIEIEETITKQNVVSSRHQGEERLSLAERMAITQADLVREQRVNQLRQVRLEDSGDISLDTINPLNITTEN